MDVYYRPEAFGLTLVGEVDWAGGYEYDKYAVWRDGQGRILAGWSTGCSCSTPFRGQGLTDLHEVSPESALAEMNAHNERFDASSWGSYSRRDAAITELFERIVRP